MNTKYAVKLTEAERARLRTWIGQGTAPARQLTRARILLKANQGESGPGSTDGAIAGAAAVARVRGEYGTAGLDAALERKPADRVYPRRLDGAEEAQLVVLAWRPPP